MQKSAVHKTRDLSPELRLAAETLLGQTLDEDETVTLRATKGHIIKEAPTGKAREEMFQCLSEHRDSVAERVKDVPAEELNALADEAAAVSAGSDMAAPGAREREWVRSRWREYAGLWVALDGNRLVGEATGAREALEKARAAGVVSPFLVHVTEPSELPFGGW